MLFWIVAAALTAGVVLLIVPPLLKPRATTGSRAAYDLEVYRDQLAELDRDRDRGLISDAQATAAKAEIGRRMLSAADEEPAQIASAAAPRGAKVLAALLAVVIPVGALAVYGTLGRPQLPAQPLASRNLEQERNAPPKTVLAAVEKLRAQLEQNPDDAQGWSVLGQAYAKMGRASDAVEALRKAADHAKDDPEILGTYGEMLTSVNGGTVPEEARAAFDTILTQDPKEPRARFYAALARFQAGDQKEALERWRGLLSESPADAPWVPVVRGQIAEAAKGLGLDPASVTPEPLPAEQPPAARNGAPEGQNQPQNPANMNPQDREQMIRGMVASLAARLESNPADVEGWLKLARSYAVLGDGAKAVEAARKARDQAPDRPDVLVAYASVLMSAQAPKTGGQSAGQMPAGQTPALPEDAAAALRKALAAEPSNRDALWLLGLDAAGAGRRAEAAELWGRLLALFKPNDPEYALIRGRLDALKAGG